MLASDLAKVMKQSRQALYAFSLCLTSLRRLNTGYENLTEGTMEVVQFEPNRVLGAAIREGDIETGGQLLRQRA